MNRPALPAAQDLMQRRLLTIAPDTKIEDAVRHLLSKGHAAAPVVESNGRLLGIASEQDCVRFLCEAIAEAWPTGLVRDPTTKEHETVSPDEDVLTLASRYTNGRHCCLLVEEAVRLIGLIARRELMRGLESIERERSRGKHKTTYEASLEGGISSSLEFLPVSASNQALATDSLRLDRDRRPPLRVSREPTNRGVVDGYAAFGPIKVEVPSPARALPVESEQAPERRILGRETPRGVGGEDSVMFGTGDQFFRERSVGVLPGRIVDRNEEMEAARSWRVRDTIVAFGYPLVTASTLGSDGLPRKCDREDPQSATFAPDLEDAVALSNFEPLDLDAREGRCIRRRRRRRGRCRNRPLVLLRSRRGG